MTEAEALLDGRLPQLVRALRDGLVSSRELLEVLLDRREIDRELESGGVNAVVEISRDALRDADRADAARTAGRIGPLAGLPMTVKLTFDVSGFPPADDNVAAAQEFCKVDADVVAGLKAAGAVVFGRTNAPPGAADIETSHPVFGRTVNPRAAGRSAGGSSGGSAAAVGAGHTMVDIGSDVSGSVRIPAHCCGVYGFRPTEGVLPQRGHRPGPRDGFERTPMLTPGPLARHPEDLAVTWTALTGQTIPTTTTTEVAWHIDPEFTDPQVSDAFMSTLDNLRRAGVAVREVELPRPLTRTWLLLQKWLFSSEPADWAEDTFPGGLDESAEPVDVAVWAAQVSHREWLRLANERAHERRLWQAFSRQHPCLLLPTMPTAAPVPRDTTIPVLADRVRFAGRNRPLFEQSVWCSIASVAALPAAVLPGVRSAEGLPVGVQVIGAHGQDADLLSRLPVIASAAAGTDGES